MRLERPLSEDEIGALIARLHAEKIRPGTIVTSLWHAGYLVPPLIFLRPRIAACFYTATFFIVMYVYALAMMGELLPSDSYFKIIAVFCMALIFNGSGTVAVNRRRYAWMIGGAILIVTCAAIVLMFARASEIDWTLTHLYLGRNDQPGAWGWLRGWWIILLGTPIYATGMLGRYYGLRRKLGWITWRQFVEQRSLTGIF